MNLTVPILRLYCGEYECLDLVTGDTIETFPDCQTRTVPYRRCWRYPAQSLSCDIDFVLERFDVWMTNEEVYRMYAYVPEDEAILRYYPIITFLILQQGVRIQ